MTSPNTTLSRSELGSGLLGIFMISMSTLLLQLGLTRIFSVTIYYHMAFFAVSVALTRYPERSNLFYGVDLAGAAMGCLLFTPLISFFGGPVFIVNVALLAGLAGLVLALGIPRSRIGLATRIAAIIVVLALG